MEKKTMQALCFPQLFFACAKHGLAISGALRVSHGSHDQDREDQL
jgi:hypothetical protein